MSVITSIPEPNLWAEICKVAGLQRPPFKDEDAESVHTSYDDFDPSKHNPVFYGKMHEKISGIDSDVNTECDPAMCHPSLAGYTLVERPPKSPPPPTPPRPERETCSPRGYLEAYIFPKLLPALEEMLKQAKLERCFERKRTKFNGLDFLTEYLYGNNPQHADREPVTLGDIPFVMEHWKDHPRPPLPMSLLWTEEEATLIIQSFWRGYKVRCQPEIKELRVWQREWREENSNIKNKVSDFWARQMPEGADDDDDCDFEEEQTEESSVAASPVQCEQGTDGGDEDKATETESREPENQVTTEETNNPVTVTRTAEQDTGEAKEGTDVEGCVNE